MDEIAAPARWRRFTQTDWYGLAGAERFPNGDEPLIRDVKVDGTPAEALVDARGAQVILYDEDATALEWQAFDTTEWRGVAWLLLQSGDELTAEGLLAAGFERLNV